MSTTQTIAQTIPAKDALQPSATEPTPLTKTCPRCGAVVFADMDVCYGCLYDFRQPSHDYAGSGLGEGEGAQGVPWADGEMSRHPGMAPVGLASPPEGVAAATLAAQAAQAAQAATPGPVSLPQAPAQPLAAQAAAPLAAPFGAPAAPIAQAPGAAPGAQLQAVPASPPAAPAAVPQPSADPGDPCQLFVRVRWRGLEAVIPLEAHDLTIGREPQSDVMLSDFTVRERHARLHAKGAVACVELLDSEAKAAIDGLDIHGSAELSAGQELDIAGTRFSLVRRRSQGDR